MKREICLSAIIVASGESKRFGKENKLLHEIDGKKIIQYIVEKVVQSNVFSDIIIVTSFEDVKRIFKSHSDIKIVMNSNSHLGISQSIKLGVENSSKDSLGYMFFQGDMPFLELETICEIVDKFSGNIDKIVSPKKNSPKIFSRDFKEELLNLKGDVGGKMIVLENMDKYIELEFENISQFKDIDYIGDIYGKN
ncbi:MAG: NTP transferase domain-containing protein [Lachnospirales bacterium]